MNYVISHQLIKCKPLLSIYSQLCAVQYGEFGRWSLVGVEVCQTTNSPKTVHTFCSEQVGRIELRIFGASGVKRHWLVWLGSILSYHCFVKLHRAVTLSLIAMQPSNLVIFLQKLHSSHGSCFRLKRDILETAIVNTEIRTSSQKLSKEKNLMFKTVQNKMHYFSSMSCVCGHARLCHTTGLMYLHISYLCPCRLPTGPRRMIVDKHSMSEKDTIPKDDTTLVLSWLYPKFKDFSRIC